MVLKIDETLSTVEAGEAVTYTLFNDVITQAAVSPCGNPDNGNWVCVTHDQAFANNINKDSHISRGKHTLAWVCTEHGVEEP